MKDYILAYAHLQSIISVLGMSPEIEKLELQLRAKKHVQEVARKYPNINITTWKA